MGIAIKNVRIIDGNGSCIENGYIVFDENGIAAVSEKPLTAEKEIDGTGKTVMPGLIDSHVHLGMLSVPDGFEIVARDRETEVAAKACGQCQELLKFGITTVRNMGTKFDADIYLRNMIEDGLVTGPRIVASGSVVAITGGHGYHIARECDTVEEALRATRTLIKNGAQVIKCMATGGVLTKGSVVGAQQLSYEQMSAIAEEAKRTGRITGAHCIGYEGTKSAILAGIDTIEHGYMLDEALIELMAERGTYFSPTLIASRAIATSDDPAPYAVELRKKIAPIAEGHIVALEKAIKAGLTIVAGTDCGTPWNPVSRLVDELDWYVKCGMSNMAALISATKNPAKMLKISQLTGTLEKGKAADLVMLNGNPLENIRAVADVERTYRNGHLVYERGSAY